VKPIEVLFLILGVGIIVRGVIDHGLTATELGAGMFFVGLVPVRRADKANGGNGNGEGLAKVILAWIKR
jgi:hypothetical protein